MPLDRDHVVAGPLQRLDVAIKAAGGDGPARGNPVDRLVVERVDTEPGPVELVEQAARLDRQVVTTSGGAIL